MPFEGGIAELDEGEAVRGLWKCGSKDGSTTEEVEEHEETVGGFTRFECFLETVFKNFGGL